MKIHYDRNRVELTVSEIPVGVNKVLLTIPEKEYSFIGENGIEIGNFTLNLEAELKAIKVETVIEDIPILTPSGEPVVIDGIIQTEPKTITTETVIATQIINLAVL